MPAATPRLANEDVGRFLTAMIAVLTFVVPVNGIEWNVVPFLPPDGLRFEEVREICTTPDGSTWFGSWGCGVARLNGANWLSITDQDSLPSNFCSSLVADDRGDVWVATSVGPARISNGKVQTFEDVSLFASPPNSVACMSNGEIWFGNEDGAIVSCRTNTKDQGIGFDWSLVKPPTGDSDSTIRTIYESEDGKVWLAMGLGGLAVRENNVWKNFPTPGIARINDVLEDSQGALWIACGGKAFYLEADEWQGVNVSESQCLANSPDGTVICGSAGAIFRLNNQTAEPLRLPISVGRPDMRRIRFTSNESAWVGTKEGILRIMLPRWQMVSSNREKFHRGNAFHASPEFSTVAIDAANRLVEFDDNSLSWRTILEMPGTVKYNTALFRSSQNRIVVRSGDDIFEIAVKPPQIVRTHALPDKLKDSHQPVKLFTNGPYILVFGEAGLFRLEQEDWHVLSSEPISSIQKLQRGSFLIGFHDRATLWTDGAIDKAWKPPVVERPFTFAHAAQDNKIWFGSRGLGLFVNQDDKTANLTMRDGLPSSRIICALEASDGTMWFGAEHTGISSLKDGLWIHYSHADGLPSQGLVTMGERPAGTIWAAYDDFKIVRYQPTKNPPETTIIAAPKEIAPHERSLFSFTGYDQMNHTPPDELLYSWRLKRNNSPDDAAWSDFDHHSTITTESLSPGNYLFQVRAQDRDRNIDPTPAELEIKVLLPIWQHPAVVIPLLVLFLVAILLSVRMSHYYNEIRNHRDHLDDLVRVRTQKLVKLNEQINTEKKRLDVTLRSMGDAVIATDDVGTIVLANPNATAMFHCTEDDLSAKKLSDVVQFIDFETHRSVADPVQEMLEGRFIQPDRELIIESPSDESKRIVSLNGANIRDEQGCNVGVVIVIRDITLSHQLKKEQIRSNKLESLGVLAGGIAHDFNNLLCGILTNISLVRKMDDESQKEAGLVDSEKACKRAQGLASQLLTFSAGGAPVREVVSLVQTLEDCARFSLKGSNIDLIINIPDDLYHVSADLRQLSQVFQNIVINADQAMTGGGTLKISARNIDGTLPNLKGNCFVRISFHDNGVGIENRDLTNIFDPYYSKKDNNTGLGLAISHSIIAQHDGQIRVSSTYGVGTRFDIDLPSIPTSQTANQGYATAQALAREPGPANILVMDDEPLVLRAIGASLKCDGHRVFAVLDSASAIELFSKARDDGTPIDLVVLDLTLPGESGGQSTLEAMRRIDPNVRSIVSSGYADDPVIANSQKFGFDGRIIKPFSYEELQIEVNRVLTLPESELQQSNPSRAHVANSSFDS